MPENYRFRTSWRGKLILQRRTQHYKSRISGLVPIGDGKWHDASVKDLHNFFTTNKDA